MNASGSRFSLTLQPDDPRIARVLRARLHLMMRGAIAAIPLGVPLVTAIMWPQSADQTRLLVWSGIAVLCGLLQWFAYLRLDVDTDWTKRAVATQAAGGVVWGLFPWLTMPDDPIWQALAGGVVLGVLTSAALFASALRSTYLAFLLPATTIGAFGFLVQATGDARWMAICVVSIAAFALALAELAHRSLLEAAELAVQLDERAHTDALTGLPNRAAFMDALESALADPTVTATIAFIDLDGFKSVNDEHGHDAGDDYLRAVASRLALAVRADETVARFGGDEFTVLATGVDRSALCELGCRVLDAFDRPFPIAGSPRTMTCSVGLAQGLDQQLVHELLRDADHAQYAAKGQGGGVAVVHGGDGTQCDRPCADERRLSA